MAKMKKASKAPAKLTMTLYAPGMSILHRAGLGGLACTLKYIERENAAGRLPYDKVPGGPWSNGKPPWTIDPQVVTLNYGVPKDAADFLQRLFRTGFDLRDDLIFLPGQYAEAPPNLPVRANLQQGIILSFLQHGRVRKLAREVTVHQYQPEGEDGATIDLVYKKCSGYKHRDGWRDLVDSAGCLKTKPMEVVGPLNPGAVVRHVAFSAQTKIEEDAAHIIPLYFALVGCLTLSINRGSGVLIVPEVTDLIEFYEIRAWMTPTTDRECQITSAGDAALQAQIRVRAKRIVQDYDLPACQAVTFRPTPWATQQKSRVQTMSVPPGSERYLDQFAVALVELPPRIVARTVTETQGHESARFQQYRYLVRNGREQSGGN